MFLCTDIMMTHADFDELLSSIEALTPEQQRAPPTARPPERATEEAHGSSSRQGRQTRPARAAEEENDGGGIRPAPAEYRPRHLASRSCPGYRRRRSRRHASHHQGRAAVGNHHPRAAVKWQKPISLIPAPWSSVTFRRMAQLGAPPDAAQQRQPHLSGPHHHR